MYVTLTKPHKSLGVVWPAGTRGTVIGTRYSDTADQVDYLVDVDGRYPTWPDNKCKKNGPKMT
jgi:hypothetical protein